MYKFKLIIICILISAVALLTSCYSVKSNEKSDYIDFHEKLKNKSDYLYGFLPSIDDGSIVEDAYLYYSDADLLDTHYVIYVKCNYSNEQYEAEYDRISDRIDEDIGEIDSPAFKYDNIVLQSIIETHLFDALYISTYYVLFDNDNNDVIYIAITDEGDCSNVLNIPKEYLPEDFFELAKIIE